jgi:hypothetical protein
MLISYILEANIHIMGKVRIEYEVFGVPIGCLIIYQEAEDKIELEY